MNEFWIGADPGGNNSFGLAFLHHPSGELDCATVSSVDEAVERMVDRGKPRGLAVDAPMWWSSREKAGRRVDEWLREKYKIRSGTVQFVNSLRGAALVGGAMLAIRLREKFPRTGITEAHPKALLQALPQLGILSRPRKYKDERDTAFARKSGEDRKKRIASYYAAVATAFFKKFKISTPEHLNEHERDAAVAAVCAREGFEKRWTADLARYRHPSEQDPQDRQTYGLAPMHYFWPESP